ncbi:site-specific integrase [Streptomyces sp. NBC_01261]|uniref:tyrosine-type recombinase/integrase n=1 Tax=Streptomyces sp. NBC_01261 TaxID=2903802 RepID=UPI002E346552|nr:tyrosine-type recombinase/integrase [Streptomyces sp. NBC_01261]
MSKAWVTDRWHYSSPTEAQKASLGACEKHSTKNRTEYARVGDHDKGMRWQVQYYDHDRKLRKENWERKTDADKRAASLSVDLSKGQWIDPNAGKETYRAVADRWMAGNIQKSTTQDTIERYMRLHIFPVLGNRPIASIKRDDLQKWVADKSRELKPSTLGVVFRYLRSVLRAAVTDGQIPRDPSVGVKLPKAHRAEEHALPVEVVGALVNGAPEQTRVMLLIAAATGLRQGELFGLELDAVDLVRAEIRVSQQLVTRVRKGEVSYLSTPKSFHSVRTVRLYPLAVQAIRAHLERFPIAPVVIQDRTDPRKPVERKANFVFRTSNGQPYRSNNWDARWKYIVKQANAQLETSGSELRVPEGASLHSLRDFYASVLIAHGESIKVVQRALGHAKPSTTLDTYVHLWEAAEDTTRDAVTEGMASIQCDLGVTPHAAIEAKPEVGEHGKHFSADRRHGSRGHGPQPRPQLRAQRLHGRRAQPDRVPHARPGGRVRR